MVGAIIIVVVLLLIPVIVLLSGGIASAILGETLEHDAEVRYRGQRTARTRRLRPNVHRRDASTEALTEAIVRYATWRVDLDPPPLDGPRTPAELRAAAGQTITRRRHRRAGGPAHLRRRPRPGVHLRRPPPVPVLRPGGADGRLDPVRPRRRGVEHLRRLVAGGGRRRVRRERGAALDRRPRRDAGDRRWRVRQRWHGGQPQRPARGSLAVAPASRGPPRTDAWAADHLRRRPLLGGPGGPGDGCRRGARSRRPRRPAHGRRARGGGRRARRRPLETASSPSSPRAARRTPV